MRLLVLFFGGVDAGGGQGGAVPHATAGPPYRPSTPPRRGPPQRPGGPAGPPRPSPGRSVGTRCGGHGGIERRPSLGEAPEGTFQTRVQPLQKCNTDPQKSEAIKKTSKKQQQKNNRKITEKHKIRPILPMSQHIFKSKKTGLRPPTCLYPCAEPLRCIRVRTGSSIGLDDPDRKTGPSGTTQPRTFTEHTISASARRRGGGSSAPRWGSAHRPGGCSGRRPWAPAHATAEHGRPQRVNLGDRFG